MHALKEDPHIWYGNRDVADFLSVTFHDVPFFYLSHFAWIGEETRQSFVTIQVSTLFAPAQIISCIQLGSDEYNHLFIIRGRGPASEKSRPR